MKPQHFAALAAVLLGMALLLLLSGRPTPGSDQAADSLPRTVVVTGEGEMRTRPDQVILTFGVSTWTQGASAGEAEALHLASRDRLTESLRRTGLALDDIEPSLPVVTPLTRQDYAGVTYLTGYQAVSRVAVTIRNVQRVDAVIAAGLANGATSLDSAFFGLQNPEPVRQQAVQAALANARSRAAAIAEGQERSLGELLTVEVLEEEAPTPDSAGSSGELLFRVRVRAIYRF